MKQEDWKLDNSWRLKASCRDANPEVFEIAESFNEDDPMETVVDHNGTVDRFNEAKKHCRGCPVKELCLSAATEDDLKYTFRAGLLPSQFVRGKHKRPANSCPRGHEDEFNQYGRCLACNRIYGREYYLKQAARKAA